MSGVLTSYSKYRDDNINKLHEIQGQTGEENKYINEAN